MPTQPGRQSSSFRITVPPRATNAIGDLLSRTIRPRLPQRRLQRSHCNSQITIPGLATEDWQSSTGAVIGPVKSFLREPLPGKPTTRARKSFDGTRGPGFSTWCARRRWICRDYRRLRCVERVTQVKQLSGAMHQRRDELVLWSIAR